MRNTYYVTTQVKFPQSTFQKCGFTQRRWTHVQFKTPRRKKGDYWLARSKAFADANERGGRIVEKTDSYIIWRDGFGVYRALWLEGHDPTDKYHDYWFGW